MLSGPSRLRRVAELKEAKEGYDDQDGDEAGRESPRHECHRRRER
jgi:hypothetical protein